MVRMNCLFLAKWEKNRTPKGPAQSEYAVLIDSLISVKMRIISVYIKKPDQCERRFCKLCSDNVITERSVCFTIPWVITSPETSSPWWKSHVFQTQHSVQHVVTTSLPAQEGSHVLPMQAGCPQGWGHATKNTTGNLSNESCWSSAGLKSNGAKRVVQSGELSWLEEHVVQ